MPNIDEDAKRWELDLAGRIGRAVASRRKALRLSAVVVSERTKDLGYPITRVTISKIENNSRAGKVDVAELLILAAALEIPPALLMFPDFPDGQEELLPDVTAHSDQGARWIAGNEPLPMPVDDKSKAYAWRSNVGTELVEIADERRQIMLNDVRLRNSTVASDQAKYLVQLIDQQLQHLERLHMTVDDMAAQLWGERTETDE